MGKIIDITGKRFGHWTVLERDNSINKKNIYWKCKCDCGTIRSVSGTSLKAGISESCGCEKNKKTSIRSRQAVAEDLTGQHFGHWTVLRQDLSDTKTSKRGSRWICRCDCGKEKSVLGYALRRGQTKSCGCQNSKRNILDLKDRRFGKLLVLEQDSSDYDRKRGIRWICRCDCGKTVSVLSGRLVSGQTRSCGCLVKESKPYTKRNLTGQQFGHWTVLERDYSRTHSSYFCKCSCGQIKSVGIDSLVRGLSKSCGCARMRDLTGKRFGKLIALDIDDSKRGSGVYWKCKCDCGTVTSVKRYNLLNGSTTSCGCENRRKSSQRRFNDMTGQRFGRLIVDSVDHKEHDNNGNSNIYWRCKCDCGNETVVEANSLRSGYTQSCGCLAKEASAQRAIERTIDMVGKRFGLLTVIERVPSPDDERFSKWKCKCDCGNIKLTDGHFLRIGAVTSCGCLKQSKYELFVLQYFENQGYENSIDYVYQIRFDDLRGYGNNPLSYDFAFYRNGSLVALIECQGMQHYKPVELFGGEEQFAKQQLHDEAKANYAKKKGIPLIEIPYTAITYEDVAKILKSHDL